MRLVAFLVALAVASPALAGQPVSLKLDAVDADGMVTLGDLFDGAGAAGRIALAPRQGASVVLDAAAVQMAARRAGLDWANAEGLRKILVRGRASAASAPSAPGQPAAAPRGNVDVLTYARNLAAGDIVQPTDLVWGKAAAAPNDAPSDPDLVIGQAVKRPLRAGQPVAARDVGVAQVIKLGDVVSVSYDADGISLNLQGKAMSAGGVGETIGVQNPSSKKIIQAVVTGPGQAAVGPAAEQLKSARSSIRYAAR